MVKALALELLEFLYNELKKSAEEGVYSGEVLEQHACSVLANLHASKDPFGIYRQELVSHDDHKKRLNNPLSQVIRRLTEELFAITTTISYPILLTPKLYMICVSLLSELSLGRLPPLFLETYDGHVDKFEKDFKPLMLEMFIRRAPWRIIAKNLNYLIENISLIVADITCDNKVEAEFQDLSTILGADVSSLAFLNFLPLFFTNLESLKKGILEGRYLFKFNSSKEKAKLGGKKTSNLVDLSAIIEKSRIVENFITYKKNEKADLAEKMQSQVLNNFALARISISALIKIFSKFGVESDKKLFLEFDFDFNYIILSFEQVIATLLSGAQLFNSTIKRNSDQVTDLENNKNSKTISKQIFELDGSISNDFYTIEKRVNTYLPFHFFHIQAVSGLRSLVISLSHLKSANKALENNSGLNDLIVAYIMRILNQIEMILEFQRSGTAIKDQENHTFLNSKLERYLELIPSETILLIKDVSNYYSTCKTIFNRKLLDIHISQLKSCQQSVSPFFMILFTHLLSGEAVNNLDCELLTESWDRIFREIVFPNLLDSYKIDLFISTISNPSILNSLSKINIESFLNKYLGVFTRILAYHPDLSAKSINVFIMNSIKILKDRMPNFDWLANWLKIILNIICTPLMTFFPQKVNCDINDLKAALCPFKPNNKILNFLSILVYPKIYSEKRKKGKPDLMLILSDLPTYLLIVTIYNSNYSGNKRFHTMTVLSACIKLIDLLVDDLINYLNDFKNHLEDESLSLFDPEVSAERKNITKLVSGILKVFPYLFHQGAKYSQEIYEKIVKVIAFIIQSFSELLFHEEIFELILNLLKLDVHSNLVIISPICWIIGQVFISQIDNRLFDKYENKVLGLIDSLKMLTESCYFKCIQFYNELYKSNLKSEADTELNGGVNDEVVSEYSNSSYSSFISDSSVEIDHVISEDELEENTNQFTSVNGGFITEGETGLSGVGIYGAHFTNIEYNSDNTCNKIAEFLDDDLKDTCKYLENIYLVEAIVSTLCKIGLSCKQSKPNIINLLEICLRKFQFGSSEKSGFESESLLFQEDQLIQYSSFILSKKISLCIKCLNHSSVFASALNISIEPSCTLLCNKSLSSMLFLDSSL